MKGEWRFRHAAVMLLTLTAVVASGRLSAAVIGADSAAVHGPRMTFTDESHDFGDIQRRGGDAEWRFEFVNDGDQPLIITRVTTTCTCLKYKYPRRPVAAGQRGHIDISFQPHKTEPGVFHRVVMVQSNADGGRKMLIVQGNSIDNRRKR